MPRGVKIEELRIGDGAQATRELVVTIRYEGTLRRGDWIGGDTETIHLGRREVIAGLRYGIVGMRVGGKRRLRVSPHLAYGQEGVPDIIPPNAVLIFEVELLDIQPAGKSEQVLP